MFSKRRQKPSPPHTNQHSQYEKLEFTEAKAELRKPTHMFEEIITHGFSLDHEDGCTRQPTIRFSLTPRRFRSRESTAIRTSR
ncbi:hypothetical protein K7432_000119 [Basidiobolus ranarum]|uniref:Uncharacterized protein n=1 Tax=Basidiobolus ranarum TaxID=34480 RepID=A0ABR2X577_9FUNG